MPAKSKETNRVFIFGLLAGVLICGIFAAGIIIGQKYKNSSVEAPQETERPEVTKRSVEKTTPRPTVKPTVKPTPKGLTAGEKTVVGTWSFYGGEAYPGKIILKNDKTFDFQGLKTRSFTSGGNWKYSSITHWLTLEFTQDTDFWKNYFSPEVVAYHQDFISVTRGKYPTATFDIERCRSRVGGSSYCINFGGWIFYLK